MGDQIVIETEGLTRRFGTTVAVDELTLSVERGETLGFLGHNGAGKTTTVRLLNGILAPHAGRASVLGMDPLHDGVALRRRTGVLTETPSLDERLSARENLSLYAALYDVPSKEVSRRVNDLLETFGLDERAEERVGGYSRGMRQRLAIARALLHQPEMLFLDEPTSGLDPVATRQMHDLIRNFGGNERTVFLCTHNLEEAQRLCDRVCVMEQGRIIAIGAPRELAQEMWKDVRLEVEVAPEQIAEARERLDKMPSVQAIAIGEMPGLLHVSLGNREAIPEVNRVLTTAGLAVYRLAAQEPTLEDVYFGLHEERERVA